MKKPGCLKSLYIWFMMWIARVRGTAEYVEFSDGSKTQFLRNRKERNGK